MISLLNQNSTREDFNFYVKKAKTLRFKEQFKFQLSEIVPILIADKGEIFKYIVDKFEEFTDYYIDNGEMTFDKITMNKIIAEFAKNSFDENKQLVLTNKNNDTDSFEKVIMSDEFAECREVFNLTNLKEGTPISARTLHEYLEINTKFKDWFPRVSDNFVENEDYQKIKIDRPEHILDEGSKMSHLKRGRLESYDYVISIEMAKMIGMSSKTHKGKILRKYFIKVEQAAKEGAFSNINNNKTSDELLIFAGNVADSLLSHKDKLIELEARIDAIENKNQDTQPRQYIHKEPSDYQKESITIFASEISMSYDELVSIMRNMNLVKKGRNNVILPKVAAIKQGWFRIGMMNGEERMEFSPSGKWKIKEILGLVYDEPKGGIDDKGLNFV